MKMVIFWHVYKGLFDKRGREKVRNKINFINLMEG